MKNLKKIGIIKSLICIVIISFAGCGGGGGGGSNVSIRPTFSSTPNIIIPNVIDKNSGYDITYKVNTENTLNQDISLKGEKVVGIYGEKINFSGNLKIEDTQIPVYKLQSSENLNGFSFGVFSENGKIENNGKIDLGGDKIVGIFGNNSDITNNKEIKSVSSNEVVGIFSTDNKGIVRNNGEVSLFGKNKSIGMYINDSVGVNNSILSINSNNLSIGMIALGKDGEIINNNKILINGKNKSCGMVAGYGARAINNGNITINNEGYGMIAFNGGYALNESNATINLSSKAFGAMIADGENSVIENRGIINIDNNSLIKNNEELQAKNGGRIINSGVINKVGKIDLNMSDGVYLIKTETDGNYGKIQSKSLNINGNLEINTGIVKGSYEDKYILKNTFIADKINMGNNLFIKSDSLLYDAILKENDTGNLDGILSRNNRELSDFVGNDLIKTANIFTKYFNGEEYKYLDKYSKNIIDKIDITDKNLLGKTLSDLTPTIYGNRRFEVLQLKKLFQNERIESLGNLKNDEYNFKLIENYYEINSKDGIEGYKNLTSGFLITKSMENNKYLSLGYSYSDVDYEGDEKGNISTIHFGLDRILKVDENTIKLGLSGEYNFHKNNREFSTIDFDSKYNSYGISSYGEISRKYNNIIEFEPFIKFELGYYKIQSFEENIDNFFIDIEKDDFIFALPEVGAKFSKKIENLNIYSKLNYSYNLTEGNNKLEYKYRNLNQAVTFIDEKDNSGSIDIRFGTNYKNEKIDFNFDIGKSFDNRDRKYIEINMRYKF